MDDYATIFARKYAVKVSATKNGMDHITRISHESIPDPKTLGCKCKKHITAWQAAKCLVTEWLEIEDYEIIPLENTAVVIRHTSTVTVYVNESGWSNIRSFKSDTTGNAENNAIKWIEQNFNVKDCIVIH